MSNHLDLVPLYKRRRTASMTVNNALVGRLSKDVLDEGGKKLGILQGKKLILDSEDGLAVLMDFCIHDVRREGHTAVELFALEAPYAPESEERAYLNTLQRAQFSVFVIERAERGCGVEVRDLRWGGTKFILDIGLGTTGSPDLLLAARILSFESAYVTSGAPLAGGPLPKGWKKSPLQQMIDRFSKEDASRLSPQQISAENATILRTFLQSGAGQYTAYASPQEILASPQRRASADPAVRVGGKDPCPCGSGKKFKKCCGLRS